MQHAHTVADNLQPTSLGTCLLVPKTPLPGIENTVFLSLPPTYNLILQVLCRLTCHKRGLRPTGGGHGEASWGTRASRLPAAVWSSSAVGRRPRSTWVKGGLPALRLVVRRALRMILRKTCSKGREGQRGASKPSVLADFCKECCLLTQGAKGKVFSTERGKRPPLRGMPL